jgi:hypothetical protein
MRDGNARHREQFAGARGNLRVLFGGYVRGLVLGIRVFRGQRPQKQSAANNHDANNAERQRPLGIGRGTLIEPEIVAPLPGRTAHGVWNEEILTAVFTGQFLAREPVLDAVLMTAIIASGWDRHNRQILTRKTLDAKRKETVANMAHFGFAVEQTAKGGENVSQGVIMITKEQLKAVESGEAVQVTLDGTECVIIKKEIYESVRELIDDAHPRTMKKHLAKIMNEDWSDPQMNVYEQ